MTRVLLLGAGNIGLAIAELLSEAGDFDLCVGDRDQMGVEFTSGDLVEQQPLGWRWRARLLAGRRGGVIQLP